LPVHLLGMSRTKTTNNMDLAPRKGNLAVVEHLDCRPFF
jgi:hypothetical protein